MKEDKSLIVLEEKRKLLIKEAYIKGINHPSVIEISKELDQLISLVQKKKILNK